MWRMKKAQIRDWWWEICPAGWCTSPVKGGGAWAKVLAGDMRTNVRI